jgi:hypothetical protein
MDVGLLAAVIRARSSMTRAVTVASVTGEGIDGQTRVNNSLLSSLGL